MDHTLEKFKANLTNVVRPNRFMVEITAPKFVRSMNTLKYYATSASIPDRNFSEIEIKYYGMSLKIPASEIVQDLSITFMMDEGWNVRNFFEEWASGINDRRSGNKKTVTQLFDGVKIQVYQLGFDGIPLASYQFEHVFLKTLDQVELNMDSTDSISTFQVIFGYSYWRRISKLADIPEAPTLVASPILTYSDKPSEVKLGVDTFLKSPDVSNFTLPKYSKLGTPSLKF